MSEFTPISLIFLHFNLICEFFLINMEEPVIKEWIIIHK